MEIHVQKLKIIEQLMTIKDEDILGKILQFIEPFMKGEEQESDFTPEEMEEINRRIERSEKDIREGRTISHDKLMKELRSKVLQNK